MQGKKEKKRKTEKKRKIKREREVKGEEKCLKKKNEQENEKKE